MGSLSFVGADHDDTRRRVLWSVPTALAALGTVGVDDAPHLMNISWVVPVANGPTRLVASVEKNAKSTANLRARPVFALSLLAADQRELGRAFVKPDLAYARTREGETLHGEPVARSTHQAPYVARAVAVLAGDATEITDLGDHVLFLLAVTEIAAVDELFAGPASAHAVDVLRVQMTRMNYGA